MGFRLQKDGLQGNESVCSKCLIRDGFFGGGGSHAPSTCPNCGGYETTLVKKLKLLKRMKANKLHRHMWQRVRIEKMSIEEYCKEFL